MNCVVASLRVVIMVACIQFQEFVFRVRVWKHVQLKQCDGFRMNNALKTGI